MYQIYNWREDRWFTNRNTWAGMPTYGNAAGCVKVWRNKGWAERKLTQIQNRYKRTHANYQDNWFQLEKVGG
jgi:hypothetical protein